METYFTAEEAADFIGIDLKTMREAMSSGEVSTKREDGELLVAKEALLSYRSRLKSQERRFKRET